MLPGGGQMIDVSIVPVPIQHVSSDEKAQIKRETVPSDWSPEKRRQVYTQYWPWSGYIASELEGGHLQYTSYVFA